MKECGDYDDEHGELESRERKKFSLTKFQSGEESLKRKKKTFFTSSFFSSFRNENPSLIASLSLVPAHLHTQEREKEIVRGLFIFVGGTEKNQVSENQI